MLHARRALLALSTAALLAGTTAACGSSGTGSSGGSAGGASGTIVATTGSTSPFTSDFNPFSPNVQTGAIGMIYEPLMFFNTAKSGDIESWLAKSYSWGAGGTSITFTLRSGVQWNDGKAFSADDVAFTFNMEAKNAALNTYGLPISNAVANSPTSVTINFSKPAYTDLYYLAGKSMILPEHVWQSVTDPKTFADANPVGTGAYMVGKVSSQVMDLTANPHYYQAGLPKVKTIRFLAFTGNTTADQAIESGEIDWGGGFIPNIQTNYLKKSSTYKVEDIPLSVTYLLTNDKTGPTANKDVRQAISDTVDRNFISTSVYNGYAPAINPLDLLTPNFSSVLDPSLASQSFGSPDATTAESLLNSAGYTMGSDGYMHDGSGKDLEIAIKVPTGWSDYISIQQIVQQELKAVGIKIDISTEAYQSWINDQNSGNFQILIDNFGYTPDAYAYYDQLLDGSKAPAIGKTDQFGDFGRFDDPQIDALLNTISQTADASAQKQDFYQIEQLILTDLPTIPLFAAQDEIEFNGGKVTGYPTTGDAYAAPPIWLQPDEGWVAMHLTPAS
ncbi:ABC transporter substrate-binding protein [Actinospica durhamensis]|uniref:ABC transporter substrate-binding protein n=1 Tax=Actinospica durhamensis TaxID=1508375 RepID=A0A941EXM9_9ACTN|nr:ABC transporter substrate-binding protein [Actinospica durhamensis]MBR7839213.1 ABC transporter substrate-binding protein [Actinospica durhamensis]